MKKFYYQINSGKDLVLFKFGLVWLSLVWYISIWFGLVKVGVIWLILIWFCQSTDKQTDKIKI